MFKSLQGFWKSVKKRFHKPEKKISDEQKPVISEERPAVSEVIAPRQEKLYVQVGIDFGTSCSKACYQIHDGRQKVYLIDFKHNLKSFPSYAIPSVLIGDEQGGIFVGEEAGIALENGAWGSGLRNFKTLLASTNNKGFLDKSSEKSFKENLRVLGLDKDDIGVSEISSLYIAYMMRRCKEFLSVQYQGRELDINYNVCIPIDYAEKNAVKTDFENMLAVAQKLNDVGGGENGNYRALLRLARSLKESVIYDASQMKIFAIPEGVAELAGYRMSAERDTGLHVLIDIGSGTTDVSILRLDRGIKERAVWLSSDAIPMGMYQLEKVVVKALRKQGCNDSLSEVYKVFENLNEDSMGFEKEIFLRIRKRIQAFVRSKQYKRPWRTAVIKLRRQKRERLEDIKIIFVGGGGSKVALTKGIDDLFRTALIPNKHYKLRALSCPSNLGEVLVSDFWRLSVAYGLSFPAPTLGEYRLPNDFPEEDFISLPMRDYGDRDDTR